MNNSDSDFDFANYNSTKKVQSFLFGTVVLLTFFGNLLVLYAFVSRRRELRAPTHYFLANLALADFFVGCLTLPFLATYSVTLHWHYGPEFCTAWTCLHFWNCSASILSTLAVCVERYIGVKYPMEHLKILTAARVKLIILATWVLAAVLSIVPLLSWPIPPSENPLDCAINFRLGHVLVASIGIYHIPALLMTILYWKIYREVAASQKETIGIGHKVAGTKKWESSIKEQEKETKVAEGKKKQIRLAKRLAFLVGFLIFSYMPMFTVFLALGLKPNFVSLGFFILLAWFRYFNSCINPVIYAFTVPGYRKAFLSIFCGDVSTTKKSTSSSTASNSMMIT